MVFLNRVPYLLSRLDEPGIKARCVAQWQEAPPDAHHRVTREFMEGSLRQDLDRILPDGSGLSERLRREVRSLAALPFDDSVGEAPHAVAKRVLGQCRAGTWPWVASTCRLEQNIRDVRNLLPAVEMDLATLWRGYKSILRTGGTGKANFTPLRMPTRKFIGHVYRMSFCLGLAEGVVGVCVAGPDEALEDNPDKQGGQQVFAGDDSGGSEGEGQGRGPQALVPIQADGVGAAPARPHGRPRPDQRVRLLRQHLAAGLEQNSIISFPPSWMAALQRRNSPKS